MNTSTVLLFPHTHLRERELGTVLARFPRLAVCLPWTMESVLPDSIDPPGPSVAVLRPPESYRPDGDFSAIIRSYTDWMTQGRNGDFSGFVKALQDGYGQEGTRWEIGRMIRRGEAEPDTTRDDALNWHLVLHLARQAEETRDEADIMLSRLKDLKPPLEDALGEDGAGKALFDDLTPFGGDPTINSRHIHRIMAAWMGLFGGHLQHYDTLLTLDPQVMDFAMDLFGETPEPEDMTGNAGPDAVCRVMRRSFPAVPENKALGAGDPARGISGKTLILIEP
ncbi:MAG: hypothetical protein JRF65_12265 [Deltaproteobacteria bacterium]|nr:hypothetical protein [Deltaproteobacteria bacterium]